jgi:hypothetical protein
MDIENILHQIENQQNKADLRDIAQKWTSPN